MNYLTGFPDEATALAVLAPFGYASPGYSWPKTKEVTQTNLGTIPDGAMSAQLSQDWRYVIFTVPDGEEITPGQLNGANAMPVDLTTGYEDRPDPMQEGATYRAPIFHALYWVGLTTNGPDDALVTCCEDNGIPYAEIDPGQGGETLWDHVVRTSFPQANIDGILMVSPIWGGTSYPFPGDAAQPVA